MQWRIQGGAHGALAPPPPAPAGRALCLMTTNIYYAQRTRG